MDLLDKAIAQSSKLPSKQASQLVFWLLLILALYLAAQVSWKAVPISTSNVRWQPTPTSVGHNAAVDIAAIQHIGLFGKSNNPKAGAAQQQAPELITDAPKTSLSILLTGVVASTAERRGVAVIESQGSQDTYSLGDKIKGTSASLKEVYADRIIITNNGRYETLMLDGLKFQPNSDANTQLQQAKQQTAELDNAQEIRDDVMANPDKLSDYIAISPVQQDGELVGYRLNPGKNAKMFSSAGFKPNDLAKSINGYDLTDGAQALEIMGQLSELTDISVMVERESQLIEISLSLPQ